MENQQQNGQSFRERVEAHYPQLGKQRKRVVRYVNDYLQTAVFLTAAQLARQVGVDAGTVVRTAQDLGYLVIAITFRRGLRETVEAAKEARAAGAYTVGLTDSQLSPLVTVCDEYILTPISSQSFAGSYNAPLAVIDAIVIALTKLDPERSLKVLAKINKEYESGNRWC